MDKNSTIGFILIAILVTIWLIYISVNSDDAPKDAPAVRDTVEQAESRDLPEPDEPAAADSLNEEIAPMQADSLDHIINKDSLRAIEQFGPAFGQFAQGDDDTITIENELFTAKITKKGAALLRWKLKNYDKWDGEPVQLIKYDSEGQYFLEFDSRDNKRVDTRGLYFDFDQTENYYKLKGDEKLTLTARLKFDSNSEIIKTYTFYGTKYIFDSDIKIRNMEDYIRLTGYFVKWNGGLKYQEKRSDLESNETWAMVVKNNETTEIDATDFDEKAELNPTIDGNIDYAAIKLKYFAAAFIPDNENNDNIFVDVTGVKRTAPNNGMVESYDLNIEIPYKRGEQVNSFRVFIGPLDYDIVEQYGLQKTINFGWWILRPIGEYLLLPFFRFLHSFIPNYGITIIIFSIFIKLLLYPLSLPQMKSARKMQLIGPEMNKIRDKYKDDQKKQQQEIMKMYSQYGINPAGGCLPLLLQMPILFALWKVFNTAIDLRQADFALWINDLSLPDYIFELPFSLFGITHLSGLALFMGITMFIQQKMTLTDPRQKAMIYMMPVMFTLLFSNLPSGLNLYYFMFNLIGIAQQVYINKFSKKKITLEDMKKSPKKEGWIQKKMREAQDIAESQGRSAPGKNYSTGKSKHTRKKKR